MRQSIRIPLIEELKISNERMREQTYSDAVKSGDPHRLIAVIKTLYIRRKKREKMGRKSTAVDERYFALAEDTLYSELEAALEKDYAEIYQMICERCEKD